MNICWKNLVLSAFIGTLSFFLNATFSAIQAQDFFEDYQFSRYDSLRGSLNERRSCYDVFFYDLQVKVIPAEEAIQGVNTIHFQANEPFQQLQVDLFNHLTIDSIVYQNQKLNFTRDSHFVFVSFPEQIPESVKGRFSVYYQGQPVKAPNPPWDGGFVWKKDKKGRRWIGVACQGKGASLWWPNKDHLSEEPDSMAITCEVPENLTAVANGDLRSQTNTSDGYKAFEWFVDYPINNYNVTVNIAHYTHLSDKYPTKGKKDSLRLDYYVLDYNREKAKNHFQQVPPMLECFEKYFGPYPFPEDGYALVETPYYGMEHQGAIAYGNDYQDNRWGFDYIIIHETGHEWWGNSITTRDHGELWIHESFTTYMESLYMECRFDSARAVDYLKSQKARITNRHPILAPTGVNYNDWPGSDMYYKGSWMLHTLRNSIENDSLWFDILKGLGREFRHTIVNSDSIITFISRKTPKDYRNFFNQYLKYPNPPTFLYKKQNQGDTHKLHFAWQAETKAYAYPVEVRINGKKERLNPSKAWQTLEWPDKIESVAVVEEAFYVGQEAVEF